jgi:hypothetical protein
VECPPNLRTDINDGGNLQPASVDDPSECSSAGRTGTGPSTPGRDRGTPGAGADEGLPMELIIETPIHTTTQATANLMSAVSYDIVASITAAWIAGELINAAPRSTTPENGLLTAGPPRDGR